MITPKQHFNMQQFDKITLAIIKRVCKELVLPIDKVIGESRREEYVAARSIIFYTCIGHGYTQNMISSMFKKNHATIYHGITKVENWLKGKEHRKSRQRFVELARQMNDETHLSKHERYNNGIRMQIAKHKHEIKLLEEKLLQI